MISRFGTLYAGHVVADDLGLEGARVNERWLSDEQLTTIFDRCQAIAQTMDRLDYDTFWAAEHHFQKEGYEVIPNLLMLYVHLAQVTTSIRFGCGFNIAPMWHPLRLAEDFATADILTGGRVIFGVGRGYHTREVETFGAPIIDQDANRELFEEQVEIILKAFHEPSFSHHGKHYDIPPSVPYRGYELKDISLVPRPRRLPVECWQPIVSGSERALDFMAKHGMKGMIGGGAASGGAAERVMRAWREALARAGRETELGADLIIGYSFRLADTEEKAIREAERYYEEDLKFFAPLGFARGLTEEQIAVLDKPDKARLAGLPTLRDGVKAGSWICGPPELVTEKLMALQNRYPGLEEINVGCTTMGTPLSETLEQLEWFGKEVMPAFKSQVKAPAAAD